MPLRDHRFRGHPLTIVPSGPLFGSFLGILSAFEKLSHFVYPSNKYSCHYLANVLTVIDSESLI